MQPNKIVTDQGSRESEQGTNTSSAQDLTGELAQSANFFGYKNPLGIFSNTYFGHKIPFWHPTDQFSGSTYNYMNKCHAVDIVQLYKGNQHFINISHAVDLNFKG